MLASATRFLSKVSVSSFEAGARRPAAGPAEVFEAAAAATRPEDCAPDFVLLDLFTDAVGDGLVGGQL